MFVTKRDGNFAIFFSENDESMQLQQQQEHCLRKTGHFAEKVEQFVWTVVRVCMCLTTRFFLTEIIICSFNNNALKKCANGKAFYIVATVSVQFSTTLI